MKVSTLDADIESYFQAVKHGGYSRHFDLEINLLNRADANVQTESSSFNPLLNRLSGLVLDDPNTGNHYALLRSHPLEGLVFYLPYDRPSYGVFANLETLLVTARRAIKEDRPLWELHPILAPQPADQSSLSGLIALALKEELPELAAALIPSMDLCDVFLLTELASQMDCLLAEAVANEITKRPSRALVPIALKCAMHTHPQAASAGACALKAIRTTVPLISD